MDLIEINHRLERIEEALHLRNQEEVIDIEEVCKITGLKKPTIYALRQQQKIPHFYFGRLLRFKRAAIIHWLENRGAD